MTKLENNERGGPQRAAHAVHTAATGLSAALGIALGTGLLATGGWLLWSRFGIDHNVTLPKALDADLVSFSSAAGEVSYYADTRAKRERPLVLIHSVNAAASAFEMKPLFEAYRGQRPVYALELPGYGFSSRADRTYTPELFANVILEFLTSQLGEAADVIALSLSCEFAARASLQNPEAFYSLTLVSPTGFTAKESRRASTEAGERGGSDRFYNAARQPLWRRAFYDLLTSPASIRYFLQKSFIGDVPPELAEYGYLTSHQPGAAYVPLTFIAGKLFTPQAKERIYAHVRVPTLVLYDEDGFVTFDTLPQLLGENQAWRGVKITPSKGLPQFEQLEQTTRALDKFWRRKASPA